MNNCSVVEIKVKEIEDSKIYLKCPTCDRDNQRGELLANVVKNGEDDCGHGNSISWGLRYETVKCCGCENVFFREISWNSEDIDHDYDENGQTISWANETITLYPEPKKERNTIRDFHLLPENIQNIYKETVVSLESGQVILTGIGIRAILETICKDKGTKGKLVTQIGQLHTKGVLSKNGADLLHKLRILGNASAHDIKPTPLYTSPDQRARGRKSRLHSMSCGSPCKLSRFRVYSRL
ncbi:DUF4145 domain-containing protein, partial [Janthinobacterium sp. HLX7-2]|uniref:DUF4145 domain-containing protein n=1 Tax=Janthinobacterium sp. HLX7-2 TaxID=1259331 RepID=UPI003F24637C